MRFPDDVPELTDGVVRLRAARPQDAEAVVEQCLDPDSVLWTTVPLDYTHDDAIEFLTDVIPTGWHQDREYAFAVEAERDGEPRFCGTISLRLAGDRRAEIAYGSHPGARGRGLLSRAVRLLLTWGFEQLDLLTVIWWANRGNWASRRLAWSLGFRTEGAPRAWLPQRGELLDAWVGTLRRSDPMQPATPWRSAVPLTDGRVRLRSLQEQDHVRVVEACSDRETSFWLGNLPQPYDEGDSRWWHEFVLEQQATGQRVAWVVADPGTDELLGAIDLFDIREGWDAEIGYWTHPAARGQGITAAAARLALDHAFAPAERGGLGLVRVQGVSALGNEPSIRVLESIGMKRAGTYRASVSTRGGRVDGALFDILLDEHAAKRRRT